MGPAAVDGDELPFLGSTTWIPGELQTAYFKASQFDRAIGAGVAILSKDPDDIIIANANLKAAEGAGNPILVRQWAIPASMTARRLITAFRPADPEGAAAWQADVDYSRQVETYCDYAIYALALQADDLTQRVELAELLKRHSPASPYIALLPQQLFILKTAVGDPLSPFRHLTASSCNEISCHEAGEVRGS